QDVADPELHELPGVCAHFVIDRDGTIYQLVSTSVICRHTVGLNYTAIGIEHVGTSDAEILGNPRQMASSLALTAWLMQKYGISLGNVIGHNESLTSPYHKELYAPWRTQTHGDWQHADMNVYRTRLRAVLRG
ncbi:MAG TPA: peptidoglycan recognition family protein, partial [Gaiellaceae bacterium]|nr:peptidoglycan recognition family protein [Gaiellaceae bacterium]